MESSIFSLSRTGNPKTAGKRKRDKDAALLCFHFTLALKLTLMLLTPSGQFSNFDKKLILTPIFIFNVAIKGVTFSFF